MPEGTRQGYNTFEVPSFESEFTRSTTNDYSVLGSRGLTRVDTAVLVPVARTGSFDLQVGVSYRRPQKDSGESTPVFNAGTTWYPFTEVTGVGPDDTPETNKIIIRPYDTGALAFRLAIKSAVANQAADAVVYYRGVHLGRR